MATINFGRIKKIWKGAYAGGTAYTVDDIVSNGGISYICTAATTGNAPPNASYWDTYAIGSDLSTISSLAANDLLYWNGSEWARQAIGTAGQAFQVNSGANGFTYGSAGKLVKTSYYEDSTRRTGSGDNVTWHSARTFYTKISATSQIMISGQFRGTNNQGNDCSVPNALFTDSAGNQWRIPCGYQTNSGHNNSCNSYHMFGLIGNTEYRTGGSVTAPAAGTITMRFKSDSLNGSSNDAWRTMNPSNSDDSRLYANSNALAYNTQVNIYEFEPG